MKIGACCISHNCNDQPPIVYTQDNHIVTSRRLAGCLVCYLETRRLSRQSSRLSR